MAFAALVNFNMIVYEKNNPTGVTAVDNDSFVIDLKSADINECKQEIKNRFHEIANQWNSTKE